MNNEMISFWHNIKENIVRIVFISSWKKTIVADINLDFASDLNLWAENKVRTIVSEFVARNFEEMDGYRKMEIEGVDLSVINHAKEVVDKSLVDNPGNCKMEELKKQMESVLPKNVD